MKHCSFSSAIYYLCSKLYIFEFTSFESFCYLMWVYKVVHVRVHQPFTGSVQAKTNLGEIID